MSSDPLEREFAEATGGLEGLRFDRAGLESFARGIARGEIGLARNRVRGRVEPAGADHVDVLESFAAAERARYAEIGRAALESGAVGCCVLNGGMATRFGGAVKGVVTALGGKSFLELKRAQASAQGPVPFVVMNSFATHVATLDFFAARGLAKGVRSFLQSASLRLTPGGDVFRGADGRVSAYAPGHGDFPDALRESGTLDWLRERGVRVLMLSNVDNLGADLDPVVIGYHLAHDRPLTAEVATVLPGDAGGAPALVDDQLMIVEGFRFPEGFDFERLLFLATNTFVMSLSMLAERYPLSWFYVEKEVDGRPAVQMERLVGELSSFVPTAFLATPRSGPEGRFFPTKTRADLDALQHHAGLIERLRAHL